MSARSLSYLVCALLAASCASVPTPPTAPTAPADAAAAAASAARPPGAPTTTPTAARPATPSGAPATAAAAPGASPPAAATPPPPKPFAEIIKDAKVTKGWFTTYEKDDKLWLEVLPDQFEMPLAFTMNVTHGIGERGIYGNSMGNYLSRDLRIVTLRKFTPTLVQLVALNASVGPRDKSPVGFAVERSFSDSLLGNAPIVSAPHPERKSVLLELNPLLVSDMVQGGFALEQAFKQAYAFDGRNSGFAKVHSTDDQLGISVKLHYGLGKLSVPAPGSPTPPTPPPSMLPDVRSLFLGVNYSLAKLPATPMPPRIADPRVGYFDDVVYDYSNNESRTPKLRYVNRWRLEKKDEAAALSEPKQPIVFWLDRNIPEKYRAPIRQGILEWNKAYEKIGFKDAIVVKQQGADDDFDTSDLRHASVRWFIGKDVPFGARGPSVTDPRTGEILDADIELSEEMTRLYTTRYTEDTPRPIGWVKNAGLLCTYAEMKFSEMGFSLDLLDARGDVLYGSPQAEQFVMDGMKDIVAHEVGHTLGLRHNFRASTIYTEDQITDPEFSKKNGVSGSVMDYNALNISLPNQKQGTYFMSTLGPYDYWAIEYGYKPLPRETENAELAKIAGRSAEPLLAYSTDEDAGFGAIEGLDPDVNRFDLTGDPLAHYGKRVKLVREMWDKLQTKQTPAGESYEYLRRNFDRGFQQFSVISELTAKYIGGISILRDYAGTGRLPLNPVTPDKQRVAMNLLAESLFSEDNFKYSPTFLNRLSLDPQVRWDMVSNGGAGPSPTISLSERILGLQRSVLIKLVQDGVARRITDSPSMTTATGQPFTLDELYGTLQRRIWSELDSGTAVSPMRRALQREHLRWYAFTLKRESGATPSDARVIVRAQAKALLSKLDSARRAATLSAENRAHLDDAYDQLDSALKAISMRVGA